jgi:hypothetical protein
MAYRGPGLYQHYKGGHYRVWGIGRHESNGACMVVYTSCNAMYEASRLVEGVDFVLRPLSEKDCTGYEDKDPFNSMVEVDGVTVHRFERVLLSSEQYR